MKDNMEDYKCNICKDTNYPVRYVNRPELEIMKEQNICFGCAFWVCRSKKQNDDRSIVIGEYHNIKVYWIEDELSEDEPRGSNGKRFVIRKYNKDDFGSSIIITTNLWYNGKVPEALESLFTVNAEILDEESVI